MQERSETLTPMSVTANHAPGELLGPLVDKLECLREAVHASSAELTMTRTDLANALENSTLTRELRTWKSSRIFLA